MMIDHSYMAKIVDGNVKYKCNNKRNWNQTKELKKSIKKLVSFFLFSQGSNLHHQGIPVLWMH